MTASDALRVLITNHHHHQSTDMSTLTEPSKPKTSEPATVPAVMGDISSPHQLVDWVDGLLSQLESRFDDMNSQVTSRSTSQSVLFLSRILTEAYIKQ